MFYAQRSPRGFANEIDIHRFRTKAERDAFVEDARTAAEVCTAAEARAILRRKPTAMTDQYNTLLELRDGVWTEVCPW